MAYKLRKTDEDVLICEGARVSGDVTLAKGVNIWYNAVLRGDDGAITVGEGTNIRATRSQLKRLRSSQNTTRLKGA